MKKYFFLFVFVFSLLSSCSTGEKTTYYLIRHAEKDRTDQTNRNPSLNFEGEKRAQNWAEYFKKIELDAVYSTKYYRTIETATPTAKTKKLEIQYYNPSKMYDSIFQKETRGKTVLVVGHSNTTPIFANKILNENSELKRTDVYGNMDDNDNASLYIVTVTADKKTSTIEKVE
ncbi:MAG: broad specificity phosphatase PhoE [Paraglaciecola sp.]|jgi:broad specificity phosphatase PhoE